MRQGQDISAVFPGIRIIHQKIRGNIVGVHRHPEHEFFLPLQGEIQIEEGEDVLKAGPGKMIYLPHDLDHSFRSSSTTQGERLILLAHPKAWKANSGKDFPPSVTPASQLCKELLFHLLIYPKTRAAKSLVETLLQTMSEMLEAAGAGPGGDTSHLEGKPADERIKKAIRQIESKFNTGLSMEELAKGAGMSVRNLNRLFLVDLGMTPKQVITLYRIERAKTLLKTSGNSVTDVAYEVGYQSLSQFITTFRKITGRLPSEYLHSI